MLRPTGRDWPRGGAAVPDFCSTTRHSAATYLPEVCVPAPQCMPFCLPFLEETATVVATAHTVEPLLPVLGSVPRGASSFTTWEAGAVMVPVHIHGKWGHWGTRTLPSATSPRNGGLDFKLQSKLSAAVLCRLWCPQWGCVAISGDWDFVGTGLSGFACDLQGECFCAWQ